MAVRLQLIRAMAGAAMVIAMVACQSPYAHTQKSATPQAVAIQSGDVPGMQRCDSSGDLAAVLQDEWAQGSPVYDSNATEWEQWKRQGAVDAYLAVYGATAADCAAASNSSIGAPPAGLMVGLVVEFRDASGAARNFGRDSTLMGLGPKSIRFIQLAGGTTTFGTATGLGADSVVGSAVVAGARYFVASWQSRHFEAEFLSYGMAFADADNTVMDMNRRILQA